MIVTTSSSSKHNATTPLNAHATMVVTRSQSDTASEDSTTTPDNASHPQPPPLLLAPTAPGHQPASSVAAPTIIQTQPLGWQAPTHISTDNRLLTSRFSGNETAVRVEAWSALFEAATEGRSDHERVRLLMRHLEGHAINWFAEDIVPTLTTISWAECKALLISRFGRAPVRPILEAQKRYLRKQETVQDYYLDKLQLLRQTGLTEGDQVAMLTDGMPVHYRNALISAQITRPTSWLSVAQQLESSFARIRPAQQQQQQHHNTQQRQPAFAAAAAAPSRSNNRSRDNSKKPSTPCRYCKEAGQDGQFHWHNDCPRKQAAAKPVSSSPNQAADEDAFAALAAISLLSGTALDDFITIKAKVHDETVRALVDTGSNVSLVSLAFINRCRVAFSKSAMPITHIDGKAASLGQAVVPFSIGNTTQNVRVYIVELLPTDMLIGLDIATSFDLYLSCRKRRALRGETLGGRIAKQVDAATSQFASELAPQVEALARSVRSPPLAIPADSPKPSSAVLIETLQPRVKPLIVLHASTRALAEVARQTGTPKLERAAENSKIGVATPKLADLSVPAEVPPTMKRAILRNADVFAKSEFDIGLVTVVQHRIRTKPHAPVKRRAYRLPPELLAIFRNMMREEIQRGMLRRSNSPYGTPAFLVPKGGDRGWRPVQDLRPINEFTIPDNEPMPIIQELIDAFFGATYLTKLDISFAFTHIAMHPDSIELTAMITVDGLFEWLRMPMGLKNAGATFQRAIRIVLGDRLFSFVKAYLDDCVIHTFGDLADHVRAVDEVLTVLREAGFKLRFSKCAWAQPRIEILGFVVGQNMRAVAPSKTDAVTHFPRPDSATAVRRFLGLCSYMREFMPHFTEIAFPLFAVVGQPKKSTSPAKPFLWTDDMEKAFQSLKVALASPPALAIFNPDLPCEVHSDASSIGIGAVLIQRDSDGKENRVAYFSRRLTGAQHNWHATDLEGLAVVESIEHWQHYLFLPFIVYTDHAALPWIKDSPKLKGRLHRWFVRLSVFTFTLKYKKGADMQHADALSRAPQAVTLHSFVALALAVPDDELERLQRAEPPTDCTTFRHGSLDCVKRRGLTLRYAPPSARVRIMQHAHDGHGHPGRRKTLRLVNERYFWQTLAFDVAHFVSACRVCQEVKISNQPRLGLMQPLPLVTEPHERWACDTVVIGTAAKNCKAKYMQVFIDHASRFVFAFATATNTTPVVIKCLAAILETERAPKALLTDRATNYRSHRFAEFLARHGIAHLSTAPYKASTNGRCERANATLTERLRLYLADYPGHKWSTALPFVVEQYNSSPHDVTGFAPHFLHFGHHSPSSPAPLSDPLPIAEARALAAQRTAAHFASRKRLHDASHRAHNFSEGQEVLMRVAENHPSATKLTARYIGPFVVLDLLGPNNVRISRPAYKSASTVANVNQLKPFVRADALEG